jgi:hypothetical protein
MQFEQIEFLERWRSVVGYEGFYEVSNWGRVRSLARVLDHYRYGAKSGHTYLLDGKLLSLFPKPLGYLAVSLLSKDHKRKQAFVHHLVAEAWLGTRPVGKHIDHKDGNKQNNCVWNLHYLSQWKNSHAGNFSWNTPRGEKHCRAKLSDADVVEIRRLAIEGMKQTELAKMFNVRPQTIGKIINLKRRVK